MDKWINRTLLCVSFMFILLFVTIKSPIYASSEHVIDEMDLLKTSEIEALESEIISFRETYATDAVIVITDYLKDGNYYESCNIFITDLTKARSGQLDRSLGSNNTNTTVTGNSTNMSTTSTSVTSQRLITSPIYILVVIVISLLAGGIPTGIITYQSKGKNTVSNRTYEATNSFNLNSRIDQYTHETITQRVIQTNNNASGGGTHTGSSGSSHGGGGKSF